MTVCEHQLLVGSFPALEEHLGERLSQGRPHPLSPVLGLAPSNALASRIHRVAAEASGGACANLRLHTLLDLAGEVLHEGGPLPGHLLEPGERAILVRRLLERCPEEAWRQRAHRSSFVRRCASALGDLREAGAASGRAPLREGSPLAWLLHAYEELLESTGRIDREGWIREGAARLASSRLAARANLCFVYGFYELTPLQKDLVSALATTRPVTFYLPSPGEGARPYTEELSRWCEERLGVRAVEVSTDRVDATGPRALASRLFTLSRNPLPQPAREPLEIVTAAGPAREADEVARALIEGRRAGIPWGRMAVLLRDRRSTAAVLLRALRAHRVPHQVQFGTPLLAEPAAAAVADLVRCLASGFPWEPTSRLLASPWLDVPATTAERASWPSLVRGAGITGGDVDGPHAWRRGLDRLVASHGPPEGLEGPAGRTDLLAPSAEALRGTMADLLEEARALARHTSARELACALRELLSRWLRWPEGEEDEVPAREATTFAAIEQVLERVGAFERPGGETTPQAFARDVLELMEAVEVRPPTRRRDGVAILDLMEGRGLSFDLVVVPGVVAGSFPPLSAPDPLLPEETRRALGLRPHAERIREERLLFALSVGAASRRVVLVRQRSDEAGRPRSASPFEREALRARFGDRVLDPEELGRDIETSRVRRDAPVSPLHPFTRAGAEPAEVLHEARRTPPSVVSLGTLHRSFRPASRDGHAALDDPRLRRALEAASSRRAPTLGPWDGLAGRGELEEILSPTRLEAYGRCPFVYYARHALHLEPVPRHAAYEEPSRLDRGALTHEVLDELYRTLQEEDLLPLGPETLEPAVALARSIVDRAVESRARHDDPRPAALWERERHLLQRRLTALLNRTEEHVWMPFGLEVSFGSPGGEDPSTEQPLRVELPSGRELHFRGRIDRIDRGREQTEAEGLFRIVDYKSGGPSNPPKELDALENDLYQLPLYRLAAQELLLPETAGSPRAAYLYLREDAVVASTLASVDQDRLLETIQAYVEGIEAGRFFPLPNPTCRFCDFAGICRREPEWRLEERIRADERAHGYLKAKSLFEEED